MKQNFVYRLGQFSEDPEDRTFDFLKRKVYVSLLVKKFNDDVENSGSFIQTSRLDSKDLIFKDLYKLVVFYDPLVTKEETLRKKIKKLEIEVFNTVLDMLKNIKKQNLDSQRGSEK